MKSIKEFDLSNKNNKPYFPSPEAWEDLIYIF
jgi:hypothetical protein